MAEPVTLAEAKQQLRINGTAEDTLINGHITTAREWVEDYTGIILVEREVTETFRAFDRMRLRAWPIAPAATVTITYNDSAGAERTVEAPRLLASQRPAILAPQLGSAWPCAPAGPEAVRVTFTAGYDDAAKVPSKLRSAMLVIIRGLYDDRELTEGVEASAKRLCRTYRIPRIA